MVKVFKALTPFFPGGRTDLLQKKEFQFSAAEWSARNRQQITKSDFTLDVQATKTLFTVPNGYTFFLLSCWISLETRSTTSKATGLIRVPVLLPTNQDILQATCASTNNAAISTNFPGGLKILQNAVIQMISSSPFTTSSLRAGIFGYIEPNPAV